jgi:hypothetical protein
MSGSRRAAPRTFVDLAGGNTDSVHRDKKICLKEPKLVCKVRWAAALVGLVLAGLTGCSSKETRIELPALRMPTQNRLVSWTAGATKRGRKQVQKTGRAGRLTPSKTRGATLLPTRRQTIFLAPMRRM